MIIQLEEAKIKLRQIRKDLEELAQALKIDETTKKIAELEALTVAPGFWNDPQTSTKTLQEIKQYKDKVSAYQALVARTEDAHALAEMAIEENDESFTDEVLSELSAIEAEEETQRLSALLTGEYDANNAILSFHPGAGGTEAQDWAQMLYRMYTRWGENHGFRVKLIDWLDGDEAGIKSATIMIERLNAYGAKTAYIVSYASPPSIPPGGATPPLLRSRSCPSLPTTGRLRSGTRTLKSPLIARAAQEASISIKPTAPSALSICQPVLSSAARPNDPSFRTKRPL